MQVCKKIIKNYFKYEYNDWVQPVLTSNGTMGGDGFAVSQVSYLGAGYEAFRAFDSSTSGFGSIFDKTTGYLEFYNPNPLKVTALKVLNFEGDSYGIRAITAGYIQVSNDGVDFSILKEFTNSVVGGSQTWTIDLSNNTNCYKYYRIIATSTNYANANAERQVVITELSITAQEQIIVEGTEEDYDFYTEEEIYSLPTETIKKYYKYTDIDWVQPVLTANGAIGGDSFAVSGTQKTDGTQSIWMAFDNSSSTVWCPIPVANPANAYCIIYNPKALKVLKLTILNRNVANIHVTGYQIFGSNNNSDWDLLTTGSNGIGGSSASWEIQVNSENYYKYYKFLITSGKYTSQTSCSIAEIKIMAQEQIVVNGTEEDYDFYTDNTIYYAIN